MADKSKLTVSDSEIALIKKTFAENDDLVIALRALFFGLQLTDSERKIIQSTFDGNDALKRVIRKRFLPTVSRENPIGVVTDVWLGVETQIFGVPQDTIFQAIKSKELVISMVKTALNLMDNIDGEKVNVEYDPNGLLTDPYGLKLLARNQFVRHIETQLSWLYVIAGQSNETPDQRAKADGNR